jgi:hypothetical protein
MPKFFFAYPATPADIGATIEKAKSETRLTADIEITTWRREDLGGSSLVTPVLEAIVENDIAVADITTLNFNVVYELGYAIGLGKRGLPVFNKAYQGNQKQIDEIGIFDTLLYETYSTSSELLDLLKAAKPGRRIATEYPIDPLPLFMVLPPVMTDYSNQLTDRARRAGLRPRTFDLAEQARLAATEAARSVGSSSGVALQLLSSEMRGAEVHNIRTAFVAGLSHDNCLDVLVAPTFARS